MKMVDSNGILSILISLFSVMTFFTIRHLYFSNIEKIRNLLFLTLLDAMPEGICILDSSFNVIEVNQQAIKLLNLDSIGTFADYINNFKDQFLAEVSKKERLTQLTSDKSWTDLELIEEMINKDCKIQFKKLIPAKELFFLVRITERTKSDICNVLEQQKAKQENLLQILNTRQFNEFLANPCQWNNEKGAAKKINGNKKSYAQSMGTLSKYIGEPEVEEFYEIALKSNQEGSFFRFESILNNLKKSIIVGQVINNQGGILELEGMIQDVSKAHRQSERLRNQLDLEVELGNLKSTFISLASHEFLNPLSIIFTSIELLNYYLIEMGSYALTQKTKPLFQKVSKASKSINQILEDLATFERNALQKKKLVFRYTDIMTLCKKIKEEYQDESEWKRQLKINKTNEIPLVETDATLLYYVLLNLVSNAFKFSSQSPLPPILTLSKENNKLKIRVQDFGIGIPDREKEKIMSKNYRAKNAKKIKGTGSGLSIVKDMISKLNGSIDYAPGKEGGTIFNLSIPLNQV